MPMPSMMRTDFVSWLLLLCIARLAMWVLFCHPALVQHFINFIVPFKYQMNQTTPSPSSLNPGIARSLQRMLAQHETTPRCFGVWIPPQWPHVDFNVGTACKWIKSLQRSASLLSTHLVGKTFEFDFAPLKLQAVPVKENFECYGGGRLWHPYRRDFGIHHYDWWTPPLPNEFSKGCSME